MGTSQVFNEPYAAGDLSSSCSQNPDAHPAKPKSLRHLEKNTERIKIISLSFPSVSPFLVSNTRHIYTQNTQSPFSFCFLSLTVHSEQAVKPH